MNKVFAFAGLALWFGGHVGAATFTVTNVLDSGVGSLRWAITNANATPGSNVIAFNILDAADVQTIAPLTSLPTITNPVVVDGYTQPGTSANALAEQDNATRLIEVSAANLPNASYALALRSSDCTVRGLRLTHFPTDGGGILLEGSARNVVEGNFIGSTDTNVPVMLSSGQSGVYAHNGVAHRIGGTTPDARNIVVGVPRGINVDRSTNSQILGNFIGLDADGKTVAPNFYGIHFGSSPQLQIGGASPGARNVIAGNQTGIYSCCPGYAAIQGNFVGTDATGTLPRGNYHNGMEFQSDDHLVGGTNFGEGNLVSGQLNYGIVLLGASNVVVGNLIGTDATGLRGLGNRSGGILVQRSDNLIGGIVPGARNVIAANREGIVLFTSNAFRNRVHGNFIGTDVTGTNALGNYEGVSFAGSSGNLIGGESAEERNVISGNTNAGVFVDAVSFSNVVRGNFIGTDVTGLVGLGGQGYGLWIKGTNNVVGGAAPDAGNVIAAAVNGGLLLETTNAFGNQVQGNLIGTDFTGTNALGNKIGVYVYSAVDSSIGGELPGEGNVIFGNTNVGVRLEASARANFIQGNLISHNGQAGVVAFSGTTNNAVLANSIFENGALSIDLNNNGVTPNDPGDLDEGANHLQNFPVLTGAKGGAGNFVEGILNSQPDKTFRVEFYSSTVADPSGYGEGEFFLGATDVTTSSGGNASFTFVPPAPLLIGQFITATATDQDGNTSEFSLATTVTPFGTPIISINGADYSTNRVTVSNAATIELRTAFSDGTIFYTLDGSDPTVAPQLYTGPLVVSNSVTIRAVAFRADGFGAAPIGPLELTVLMPPYIVRPPQSQNVLAGSSLILSVQAGGTPPLGYQWLTNGVRLPGATSDALLFGNIGTNQTAAYRVVVSNAFGVVTSAVANLTVLALPVIVTPPAGATVDVGASVTLSVVASGSPPLFYQWRRNGANLAGATNSTLTLSSVQVSDGGSYTVVVGNAAGLSVAGPALLIVRVPVVLANDSLADATSLSELTGLVSGTNIAASAETDEPSHAGQQPARHSVWYRWTAPANGIARFRTTGSTFDTLLAVYVGTNFSTLTKIAEDEDRGGFLTSEVTFNATNGVDYKIAIDGFGGAMGTFVLGWELTPTSDTVPEIVAGPVDVTVREGETARYSVDSRDANLTYQWFFNGVELNGATASTLLVPNVTAAQVGFYAVQLSNGSRSVTSTPALLEIGPFPNLHSRDKLEDPALAGNGGGARAGDGGFRPASAFVNPVLGQIGVHVLVDSTNSSGCPANCNVAGSRWLTQLDVGNAATLLLSAVNNVGGRGLSVCLNNFAVDPISLGCSNDVFRTETPPSVRYTVGIYPLDSRQVTLTNRLDWVYGLPPSITWTQGTRLVVTQVVALASDVEFHPTINNHVLATNVVDRIPDATLQWFRRDLGATTDNLLSGATNRLLTLANVQLSQAGIYSLVASNLLGVSTGAVWLAVASGPAFAAVRPETCVQIGGDTNLSIMADANTIGFTTNFPSLSGTGFQWSFGQNLLLNRTTNLALNNVTLNSAGDYSVVATNKWGTNRTTMRLIVGTPPVPTMAPETLVAFVGGRVALSVTVTNGRSRGWPVGAEPAPVLYWSRDGTRLPQMAGTNTTRILSNVQLTDAGTYSVMVSNCFGVVRGPERRLIVLPLAQLRNLQLSTNGISLSWDLVAGRIDRVEYKSNLNDTQWLPVTGLFQTNATGNVTFRDTALTNLQRFYRIVSQ